MGCMELKVTVTRDGVDTDVTEAVTKLYDLMVNTMDWGSGFLDHEDVAHIRAVQVACGFEPEAYDRDECQNCGHYRTSHRMGTDETCRDSERRVYVDGLPGWESGCGCPGFAPPWAKRILGEPT